MITKSKIKDLYNNIVITIMNIKSNPLQKYFNELENNLNEFFEGSKCLGVIYTNNQDKLFFGTYIMPNISADDVVRTITVTRRYLVKEYYLELDSKLFSPQFNLTAEEITALLIHDIGALVNTSAPSEIVVKNIDQYLIDNHTSLKLSDVVHYREMLSYGFRDAIRKITSIFEMGKYERKDDTMADFIDWTDYVGHIISGLSKLDRQGQLFFNREVQNKFLTLFWVLRVYNDVVGYRLSANKLLTKFKDISPSKIEIKEFDNLLKRINRIDDDMLIESDLNRYDDRKGELLLEELRNAKFKRLYSSSDCFKSLKDEAIDMMLRQETLKDEDTDTIPELVHNINNTMSMMRDYMDNFITSKEEKKQWNEMYKDFDKQRNQFTRSHLYETQRKLKNIWDNNCGLR